MSFDFSAFQMPTMTTLGNANVHQPNVDDRLTSFAKQRLSRLVEEHEVTAVVSDGPTMEAPVTMVYAGDSSVFSKGHAPTTNEEALAVVARAAAQGSEGARGFLVAAFGEDEADGLIETVSEEKL